jgi:hypothetical protein
MRSATSAKGFKTPKTSAHNLTRSSIIINQKEDRHNMMKFFLAAVVVKALWTLVAVPHLVSAQDKIIGGKPVRTYYYASILVSACTCIHIATDY